MKKISFILLLFLLSFYLRAQIPTDSLVLYLPFNGDAFDESGNGNNGFVNGATLIQDRFGNDNSAYYFDGINDYIQIVDTSTLNPSEQLSICAWFKTQYFEGAGGNAIISKGYTSHVYPYYQYQLGVTGNYTVYSYYNFVTDLAVEDTRVHQVTEDGYWEENKWYFICLTFDGSNVNSYVNGELYLSSYHEGSINSYGQDLFIGKFGNVSYYTPGVVDDIRIFSRALTSEEINFLYYEIPCNDIVTIYDTVPFYDSIDVYILDTIQIFDSVFVNIYDTIPVYDSLTVYLLDTIPVYDSIAVTDTLIIDVILDSSPNFVVNTIKVFPNPTKDIVYINTGNFGVMQGFKIKIVNSLSQIVFDSEVYQQEYQINISDFGDPGIFFIQIIDEESNIIDVRKIILQ